MTAENSIEQPPGIIEIQAGVEAAKVIDNAPLPTTSPVATTKAVLGEYTVKIEAESPSPPPIIAAAVSIESNHASINAESSTAVPSISTLEAATATFTPPATIENANPVAANNSSPATVAHPPNQANPSSEAAVITHTQPHSSTAVTTQSQQSVATSGSVAPAPIVKSQTVGASATTIIPQQTQSSSKPTSTNQPPQLQASLSKNTSDTSGEQVRQAQNSTISRATRGNSVSIRDTLQRSNSARRKEIEAELELELAEEDEAAEKNAEKARIEALDAKIKQFSSVETKASFLVALLQLNEQILTEISEKRAKDSEIKRLNKKLEITTLKYQKELIHKQKELEDNKETVSKLHHEITSIKFVNKEEENTLQTVLEGRKNLMERLKAMEEEISRKNQEIVKIRAETDQELIKMKTETTHAMSRLTGTLTDRKKSQKAWEDEKKRLEETVDDLSRKLQMFDIIEQGKKEVDQQLEFLKKKVDELQQQNKRNAGRVAELEQALSGKETEYTVLRYELKTCKDDTTQIIKKAESLSSRVYDQDSELSQLRSENSELMKNINAASFKISELTSDIGKIRFERDEARKQKDQLSSELKKKDNYHNETKDLNEQNITSLKKEIESLQKNISSQKKSTITQFDELKKALEQRMQQTQQELFNSRRENQDLNQQLANLTSQNEMLGALSKELKRKCNKIEAEKANLTSNISDNTMSVMQNDVGTMKTLVQVEMKKAIDTLKQMEKDNQFLAYEVQKYHLHVEQKRNQGEDYDKEEPDRNAKLVKLVSDLKKIGKNPPTKADSTASFEQEIVQLTEELLSMNTVSGKTRSMKILSSKIQRKNESGVDGGNPGNKRLPPIRSASNLVAKDLTRKLQKLSKKDAELSSGGVKKVPAPAKAAPAKKQNLTSSSSGNNSRANHNYGGGEYDSTATTSKKQQAKQGVSKNIPKLPIATNKKASTRHVIEESASIPV